MGIALVVTFSGYGAVFNSKLILDFNSKLILDFIVENDFYPRGEGGGTWVNFCWVCAAGLSEPLPHYSLFCGQL